MNFKFLLPISCLVVGLQSSSMSQTAPTMTVDRNKDQYTVKSRGAHHRVWERIEFEEGADGRKTPRIHSYTELATGMHYKDTEGNWRESEAKIEILPNGAGAVAMRGQHKVIFPANLNGGLIELSTPDSKWLRSRVMGLSYYDSSSGQSVLLAEVKDSVGQVSGDNVVIYADAFDEIEADVRYTYTLAGFEQDVILRKQLSSPAEYSLNPETTWLEVLTEFVETPAVSKRAIRNGGVEDEELDFGVMKIGRGRAFELGGEKNLREAQPVRKVWERLEGRDFLIEQVEFEEVKEKIEKLPVRASLNQTPGSSVPKRRQAKAGRVLPAQRTVAIADTNVFLVADAKLLSRPGYVLDYITLNSSHTNYTFKSDTTYYISGPVNLFGTNTMEGGTVIKFTTSTYSQVAVEGGKLNCLTELYRPAVFTSEDDNSVGETMPSSTGSPTVNTQNSYFFVVSGVNDADLHDLRISYAYTGLTVLGEGVKISNVQFVECDYPLFTSSANPCWIHNLLIVDAREVAVWLYDTWARGEHLTVNRCHQLFENEWSSSSLALTNSLLVCVTNWGSTFTSGYNATNGNGSGVFQTVGGGQHYLATNSIYRNVGTTNVSSSSSNILRRTTTYPPLVYSNATVSIQTTFTPQAQRDTDNPDLGYHYPPLDHVFGGSHANTNIIFTAGTAVGWFRTTSGWYHAGHGVRIADRQTVTFDGTAESPCYWVRTHTVQEEGGTNIWQGGYGPGGMTSWADQNGYYTNAAMVQARYLRCSGLAGYDNHFRDDWGILIGRFRDSEFYAGGLGSYVSTYYFTNCLFFRSTTSLHEGRAGNELVAQNCTWYGGYLTLTPTIEVPISIKDSAFDMTGFSIANYGTNTLYATYDYNAYTNATTPFIHGGSHDHQSFTFSWQTGPLGSFYLPTNSALTNAGSTTAGLVGLYHFTTQTNQVKETNSIVDIGYHYVAVNSSGQPVDTDGDGVTDYLEDANGNGAVNSGETDWVSAMDMGLRVKILRPNGNTPVP